MKISRLAIVIVLIGCSSHQSQNIAVNLSYSNRSLQISGFNKAVIDDIARDSSDGAWHVLLPVYKMPADTEMKDFQNAQPGKYKVTGNAIIYTPDTPFVKDQVYFLRAFDYSGARNAWDFIRKQKQKGSARHKDLLFKY
ncbi:MAG: hypothetical protein JST32_15550 [Bacteroidetes bacterium]|nr:hypothetical protein [Bacteroidota bacterium]